MSNTINGRAALTADVTMPRVGAWHAKVESTGTEALSGAVTLISEGQAFVGTVIRSGLNGGRVLTKLVGGKGKLPTALPGKNYANGARVRNIVTDILREAGETLSPTSETAVLGHFLGKWEREAGLASRALVQVLEHVGAIWRVLADGTIWVGVDAFPAQDVEHVVLDEDWCEGLIEIAAERPDLRPGVTFHGQHISYVVHRLRPESLRTEAYVSEAPQNTFERIFSGLRREIDYSRKYSARVVSQDGNTLSVIPDDPKLAGKGVGTGLDRVVIKTGFPGSVKVPAGARVMVGFDGGDPDKPYAESWDGTTYTEIQLGDGKLPAFRQGDMVLVPLTPKFIVWLATCYMPAVIGAPLTPIPPILTAAGIPGAPMPLPLPGPFSLAGTGSTGNPKIKE